jgi:hypothetical protein
LHFGFDWSVAFSCLTCLLSCLFPSTFLRLGKVSRDLCATAWVSNKLGYGELLCWTSGSLSHFIFLSTSPSLAGLD